MGSPPLARGTDFGRRYVGDKSGITPACAGNSDIYRFAPGDTEDHPRLRGEQRQAPAAALLARGSPPLARGTVDFADEEELEYRITPACAGNRAFSYTARIGATDHPRLRGEQVPVPT